MDEMYSLASTGNRRRDVNLALLRHSEDAWWLVLGIMLMQEAAIFTTKRVVIPAAKAAVNSQTGKVITKATALKLRDSTGLLGPALIAASQVLKDRKNGITPSEKKLLATGSAELDLITRLKARSKDGQCELAYDQAMKAVEDITASLDHETSPSATTRSALHAALHDNYELTQALLELTHGKTTVKASDLLLIAHLARPELGISVPKNSDELPEDLVARLRGTRDFHDIQIDNDLTASKAEKIEAKAQKILKDAETVSDTVLHDDQVERCQAALSVLLRHKDLERAVEVGKEILMLQEQLELSEDDRKLFNDHVKPEAYLDSLTASSEKVSEENVTECRDSFLVALENVCFVSDDPKDVISAMGNPEILKKVSEDSITEKQELKLELGHAAATKGYARKKRSR